MVDKSRAIGETGVAFQRVLRILIFADLGLGGLSLLAMAAAYIAGAPESVLDMLKTVAIACAVGIPAIAIPGGILQRYFLNRMPVRTCVIVSCEVQEHEQNALRVGLSCETDGGDTRHVDITVHVQSVWQSEFLKEGQRLAIRCLPDFSLVRVDWKETRRRFREPAGPRAVSCPRCGAPLEATSRAHEQRCRYCGTALRC